MQERPRRAGRPTQNIDARDALILHARELFMAMPYDKVSTRLVAQKAGVNAAMIRYYFGSKEGLFETMLRETLEPMKHQLQQMFSVGSQQSFIDIMRTYYQEMHKTPHFPKLIWQVMNMPESQTQRKLMQKVFDDVSRPMQSMIFEKLAANGIIRPGMDPLLCRVSFISLMVFPFIAPASLLSIHGIELSESFLNRLLEHNIDVLKHGFLQAQGEHDENQ
ncbi:TetR/AcrR family transcriptional regulator [Vibrio cholerae]